jgi:hypothetical protein
MCGVKKTTSPASPFGVWEVHHWVVGKPIQTEAKRYYHLQQGVQVMIFSVDKYMS